MKTNQSAAKNFITVAILAFCTCTFAAGSPSVQVSVQVVPVKNAAKNVLPVNNPLVADNNSLPGNPMPGSDINQLATPQGPFGNSAGVPNVDQDQLANAPTQFGNPSDPNNQGGIPQDFGN